MGIVIRIKERTRKSKGQWAENVAIRRRSVMFRWANGTDHGADGRLVEFALALGEQAAKPRSKQVRRQEGCLTCCVRSERLGSLMIPKNIVRAMSRLWPAAVFLCSLLLPMNSLAQRGDPFNSTTATTTLTPGYYSNGGTPMVLTVYTSKKTRLDRQAVVKIF